MPRKRPVTTEERNAIVLRTTADVLDRTLPHVRLLSDVLPDFREDCDELRRIIDKLVQEAHGVGYIGRKR